MTSLMLLNNKDGACDLGSYLMDDESLASAVKLRLALLIPRSPALAPRVPINVPGAFKSSERGLIMDLRSEPVSNHSNMILSGCYETQLDNLRMF